ncbi:uncharacterized protein DFL_008122 [Arthrobotrys flagrans]|uniref:Uncharacterized protein n=1 Tax=Arthrobotrys flagrans TaxID=97331 RepID=A0A436ZMV7_ARTFL|nr:hypothetical protein DFL_008122 [Arthrobotrys flagrans]
MNTEDQYAWAAPPPSYHDPTGPSASRPSTSQNEYPVDVKEDFQDAESTTGIPQVPGYSTYTVEFAKGSFHMDYLIKDEMDRPMLYVDNKAFPSAFRGGKPDVIVHEGGDNTGPTVFASRSNIVGNCHEICFGDPTVSSRYTELKLKNWVSLTTTWSPPDSEKKYKFERIYGKEAEALGGRRTSMLSLKLTDVETGEIMATYLNDGFKTWRRAGTYQIKRNPDIGNEWDKWVICVCGVLTEKERRSRR